MGGLASQLSAFALQHVGFVQGRNDYGVLGFFTFILVVPLVSLAVMAFIRPPNWVTLGLTAVTAQLAALFIFGSNLSFDLATTCLFSFGSGFIFVVAYWTNQIIVKKLRLALSFIITVTLVTGIWLGEAWVGTNIIGNIQSSAYQQSSKTEMSSRLAALDFKVYVPNVLPYGYSIQKIVPISSSDVKTFDSPRKLTFWLGQTDGNMDIPLTEFTVTASFNPPRECGPWGAGPISVGPSPVPLPCQQFSQAGDVTVYIESPTYVPSGEYHFYFRKDNTEFTISTGNSLSPEQLQNLIAGLAVTSSSGLPADLLQEN